MYYTCNFMKWSYAINDKINIESTYIYVINVVCNKNIFIDNTQ